MTGASRDSRPVIALAAGGTGGHVFPAEALAEAFSVRGFGVLLLTDDRGARYAGWFGEERTFVLPAGRGLGRIGTLLASLRGFGSALSILKSYRPSAVVGFGGYATFPAVLAARLRGIPVCLHEQNAVMGRVNRALAKRARRIALSFEGTTRVPRKTKGKGKIIVTGNPIRKQVAALAGTEFPAFRENGICRLLVLGGSQGARLLSDVVPRAIATLPLGQRQRVQVTQQCRPEDLERVRAVYAEAEVAAELDSFFEDIPDRLAWSHLVVARAGASTVAEISAFGRPSILVPLGIATDDHQTANARGLGEAGAAWVIAEPEFTVTALAKLLQRLLLHPERVNEAAKASAALGRPRAADALADAVLRAIGQDYATVKGREGAPNEGDALKFLGGSV